MRSFKSILYTSYLVSLIFFTESGSLFAQKVISLYAGKVPNSLPTPDEEKTDIGLDRVLNVSQPTLTVFLPSKETATGVAVIICPGGGYGSLVIKREGYDVAKAFNEMGVAAFVLKYRLPSDKIMKDRSAGPLQDAQQAIRIVRQRAAEFNIGTNKIGILGFSAGGHLAATAGTHFNQALIENKEKTSLRPDFMILVYAVISFNDSLTHDGTRSNLLGPAPSASQISHFSNELQVTKETPVTFLVHAADDTGVPAENSIRFYQALKKNTIPAELHIYSKGGHGFLSYPPRSEWMLGCINWLKSNQLINGQP